jgi:hypothetical protein
MSILKIPLGHDLDLQTTVVDNNAVRLFGYRSSATWLRDLAEVTANCGLTVLKEQLITSNINVKQVFAILQPSTDGQAPKLRVLYRTDDRLVCYTPGDGTTLDTTLKIDQDFSHTKYSVAASPDGLVVVATSETDFAPPNQIAINECAWAGLNRGDPFAVKYIAVPDRYRGSVWHPYQSQKCVCIDVAEFGRHEVHLLVAGQHVQPSFPDPVICETNLALAGEEPTWNVLEGAGKLLDLHVGPDGRAYAVCAKNGLDLWVREAANRWNRIGDPTQGAVSVTPAACATIFVPRQPALGGSTGGNTQPPAPTARFDRVFLMMDGSHLKEITTWRSEYGKDPFALALDGRNAMAEIPGNDAYNLGTGDFTVELWAQPMKAGPMVTQQFATGNPSLDGWAFFWHSDGSVSFEIVTPNTRQSVQSAPASLNAWHHFAVVRTKGVLQTYVDGLPSGLPENPGNPVDLATSRGRLFFGVDPRAPGGNTFQPPRYFNGDVDEIRIWSRARRPDEIGQGRYHHMDSYRPDLRGQWGFDAGLIRDSSATGNDGRLQGGARFTAPGVIFPPEGQPYVLAQTKLMEDWEIGADGKSLQEVRVNRTVLTLFGADGSVRAAPTDDAGKVKDNIWISASGNCKVKVGGVSYTIDERTEVGLQTDYAGRVSVVTLSKDELLHPVLFVRTDFMEDGENIVVSPDRQTLHELSRVTSQQIRTLSANVSEAQAEGVASAIRTAMKPSLRYGVRDAIPHSGGRGYLMGSSPSPYRQFYLPQDDCGCCHAHSSQIKCDYRPRQGPLIRTVAPECMDCPHWEFDFGTKGFGIVSAAEASRLVKSLESSQMNAIRAAQGAGLVGARESDFARWVCGELKVAKVFVTTIVTAGVKTITAVFEYVGHRFVQALESVEDMIGLVVGILRQALSGVENVIGKLLDTLKSVFNWEDIAATRDALEKAFDTLCDHAIGRLQNTEFHDQVRDGIQRLFPELKRARIEDNSQTPAAAQARSRQDPLGDLLTSILQSPEVRWFLDKLHELGLGADAGPLLDLPFLEDLELDLRLADDLCNSVLEKVQVYFTQEGGLMAVTSDQVMADLKGLVDALYTIATGPILDQSLDRAGDTLRWLRERCAKEPIHLPLVEALLDPRSLGRAARLTPLSVLATLVAIPLTIGCKAVFEGKPDLSAFADIDRRRDDGSVSLGDAVDTATSYQTLLITVMFLQFTYSVLQAGVDARTVSLRRTGAAAVWRLPGPFGQLIGWVCFLGGYVLPLAGTALKIRVQQLQPDRVPFAKETWLEHCADASTYVGLAPVAWKAYKMRHFARKCGVGGLGQIPEPDFYGTLAGFGLAVLSAVAWIYIGIRNPKHLGLAIGTGLASLVAPLGQLALIDGMRTIFDEEGVPAEFVVSGMGIAGTALSSWLYVMRKS